jgi:hypothetical protein
VAETKHESLVERDLRDKLEQRGWEVIQEQRHSVNLDLAVRFNGVDGVVSIRAAFLPARGLLKHTYQPTYLRVVLGRPEGEPSRWAVWDKVWFPTGGKYKPESCARVVHEAMGDGWVAAAACSVTPKQTWWERLGTIETLLARAEKLAPAQDEDARREQIFGVQRRYFDVQTRRAREIAFIVVFGVLAVGVAAGLVAALTADTPPNTAESDFLIARVFIAGVCGIMFIAFSLPTIFGLRKLLRVPRKPLEGMNAIAQALRDTRAFTEVTMPAHMERSGLPLVVRVDGRLDEAKAPLSVSPLTATSSSHAVKLEAELCRVSWPEGASPDACLVPERWLTCELSGAGADLTRLPTGPREERRGAVVRWTFTGEEIDSGAVQSHFLTVAGALSSDARGYR